MSELKKYEMSIDWSDYWPKIEVNELKNAKNDITCLDGEWIKAEDVQTLEKENAELREAEFTEDELSIIWFGLFRRVESLESQTNAHVIEVQEDIRDTLTLRQKITSIREQRRIRRREDE